MKLVSDEGANGAIVDRLREVGHDVLHLPEPEVISPGQLRIRARS